MKKIVWTFGLISGGILSAMMLVTMPLQLKIGFDHGALIGYSTMVAASLLIYFGVRSYRDNVGGGTVRFWRALVVALSIGALPPLRPVFSSAVPRSAIRPSSSRRLSSSASTS